MFLAAMVSLACALTATPATGPDAVTPLNATQDYHVRALDPRARDWIQTGALQSRTFNELLRRLTKSDLIVYIEIVDRISSGADGQLLFATSTATARYVRIQINGAGRPVEMIALLGHELQHAVEIADAPHVRDSYAMATLYIRPADATHPYDSAAARVVGDRVRDELASHMSTRR